MSKHLRFTIASLVLVVLCAGASLAAGTPLVQYLGFDPATFTYTYEVTQGYDVQLPLGEFEVDAFVGAAWPYTMYDPVENNSFGAWNKSQPWWSAPTYVGYKWLGSVPPGPVLQYYQMPAWVGVFKVSVPNTMPVPGIVITRPADYSTTWTYDLPVPGVPEPSGLLVLLSGIGGAVAFLRRR